MCKINHCLLRHVFSNPSSKYVLNFHQICVKSITVCSGMSFPILQANMVVKFSPNMCKINHCLYRHVFSNPSSKYVLNFHQICVKSITVCSGMSFPILQANMVVKFSPNMCKINQKQDLYKKKQKKTTTTNKLKKNKFTKKIAP